MKKLKKDVGCCSSENPAVRGLMLDPARIPVQFDWYVRFIPWLAKWGYNTLMLNLTDDTGCAIRLKCRPELASRSALTHVQIRKLVKLATANNIMLIPLIATLGHTGYIYYRAKHRHLGDGLNEPGRNVLCPAHTESKKILTEIVEEVMDLFSASYIHVGLDETGELPKKSCRYCQKKFSGLTEPDFIARQLKWLTVLADRRHKQVMFWALGKLHKERDLIITRNAPAANIACLWYYEEKKADLDDTAVKFFIRHKRHVIGVPALACSPNTTILPSRNNLGNIRHFADIIHKHEKHPEVRGIINSVWQHTYVLPHTLIYGMAYAADQFNRSGGTPSFKTRFAQSFFGAPAPNSIGKLIHQLHWCSPRFRSLANLIDCSCMADIQAIKAIERRKALQMGEKAEKIADALRTARPAVSENTDVYDSYILAADILTHIGDRAAILTQPDPGRSALRRLADRARMLADKAWTEWDTTYDTAHPCRKMCFQPESQTPSGVDIDRYCYFGGMKKHSNKHVFWSLEKSACFLESLAKGKMT